MPVDKATAGKTIALFGLPWCVYADLLGQACAWLSEKAAEFRAAGVDEIWCVSVNDLVMGAWARDQKTEGRCACSPTAMQHFAKATGLTLDLTGKGLGLRSNRYSMLVRDGKVTLERRSPGKFEVSDAATLLAQAKA